MEYRGHTDEHLLLAEITAENGHFLKEAAPSGQSLLWMTAGGNQLNIDGRLMAKRFASINDLAIDEKDRKFR